MAKDTGDLAGDLNRARLGPVQPPAFELAPNWNIAPTSTVPILVERYDDAGELRRELHPARWGLLPGWAKDMTFSSRTFNARSETASAFAHPASNPWLWGAVALSGLLQVGVVHLEILNLAFGTAPLTLDQWLVCAAMGSTVLWFSELRKWVNRKIA